MFLLGLIWLGIKVLLSGTFIVMPISMVIVDSALRRMKNHDLASGRYCTIYRRDTEHHTYLPSVCGDHANLRAPDARGSRALRCARPTSMRALPIILIILLCWAGAAMACSLPGDGAGNGPPLSFSVNGPVVIDNNTGLVWKQRSGAMTADALLLNDALTFVGHFNDIALGNVTGWRLPSINEAISILDFSRRWSAVDVPPFAPIVNKGTQGGPTGVDTFWTTAGENLIVDEWGGGVDMPPAPRNFLRPVAGDTSDCLAPDHKADVAYIITTDTVTDSITGLMWQRFTGAEQNIVTYNTEAAYVDQVNAAGLGGYHDWRVPNVKELYTLVDLDSIQPTINQEIFGPTSGELYLSSTQHTGSFTCAYGVSFGIGQLFHVDRNSAHPIRLVRG